MSIPFCFCLRALPWCFPGNPFLKQLPSSCISQETVNPKGMHSLKSMFASLFVVIIGIPVRPQLEIILIQFSAFRARVIQTAQKTNCYEEQTIARNFIVF